ncbi:unnamed protein product, partial [Brenthis ino]
MNDYDTRIRYVASAVSGVGSWEQQYVLVTSEEGYTLGIFMIHQPVKCKVTPGPGRVSCVACGDARCERGPAAAAVPYEARRELDVSVSRPCAVCPRPGDACPRPPARPAPACPGPPAAPACLGPAMGCARGLCTADKIFIFINIAFAIDSKTGLVNQFRIPKPMSKALRVNKKFIRSLRGSSVYCLVYLQVQHKARPLATRRTPAGRLVLTIEQLLLNS